MNLRDKSWLLEQWWYRLLQVSFVVSFLFLSITFIGGMAADIYETELEGSWLLFSVFSIVSLLVLGLIFAILRKAFLYIVIREKIF